MGYVIAAILVVLIVGGFVLFLVTNAAKKSNVSHAGDPGSDQNSLGIVGSDGAFVSPEEIDQVPRHRHFGQDREERLGDGPAG